MDGFYKAPDGLDEILKDPADVLPYSIDWYEWLRGADKYWAPRTYVHPGETFTPPREQLNGKRYVCTIGGRTGTTQPTWATSGSTPFADGGVSWVLLGNEDTISTSNWNAETGLTATSPAIDTTLRVTTITLSGGAVGHEYLVTDAAASAQGKTVERRFRVKVVER